MSTIMIFLNEKKMDGGRASLTENKLNNNFYF